MVVKVLLSIGLCVSLAARPNPQTFTFDPSSPPGPLQECSDGIPKMAGRIPFPEDTALDDENIGFWVERRTECLWGNYYNNVEHIDYDTLNGKLLAPDYESCFQRTDGTRKCLGENRESVEMIRDVLDVNGGTVEVIEVNGNSITLATDGNAVLAIQIGIFQVGHAFNHPMVETFEFNEDGTLRKVITLTDDDLSWDITEWADQVLSGMGDYFKVDHANKHNYYQIDLGDDGVRVFIAFVVFWLIVATIGMAWMMKELCKNQTVNKYEKVEIVADAKTPFCICNMYTL